jgi:hypothetical protein
MRSQSRTASATRRSQRRTARGDWVPLRRQVTLTTQGEIPTASRSSAFHFLAQPACATLPCVSTLHPFSTLQNLRSTVLGALTTADLPTSYPKIETTAPATLSSPDSCPPALF